MGQIEALRDVDATIFDVMESAGLASRGNFIPAGGGVWVPVRYYLDNPEQEQLGGAPHTGGVVKQVEQISIFRADVADPQVGDKVVELLGDDAPGTTYVLASKTGQDASLSIWRARRV